MFKRNWYFIFGTFFVVIGILFLLTNSLIDGAWAIMLGSGNLIVGYGQRHPERGRGPLAWALVIVWGVVLAVLTIMRFTAR